MFHILSFFHVSLIGMSVYSALRFWGISYGWAGLGASALLTFYGLVTGFGASVFRAVFMVEVSCLAAYLGRSYDLLSALSLSLILQAWQSPYLLFSAGLQLSYGAVAKLSMSVSYPFFFSFSCSSSFLFFPTFRSSSVSSRKRSAGAWNL